MERPTPAARPRPRAASRRCTIDRVAAGRGFRLDPQFILPRQNQQPSFGAGVLDRRAHERVDQLVQDDLARHRLRDFDDRREIEMFDRRPDRARRTGRRLFLAEMRIELIELPHLAVGSPAQIAVAGVSQIQLRELLEAPAPRKSARPVRWRAPRCGQSRLPGPSGWPVRKGPSASSARPSIRAISAPTSAARFSKFSGQFAAQISSCRWCVDQSLDMLLALVCRCGVARCGAGQRAVEVILRRFEMMTLMSKAAVAPSTTRRLLQHSRPRSSAPAACGSNTSTRQAPGPDCWQKRRSIRSSSNCASSKQPKCRRQSRGASGSARAGC